MNAITQYFGEEKRESIYFICIGFIAFSISLFYLLFRKEPHLNGIAYAIVSIGLIQLVVGITVYLKSDLDTVRVMHYVEKEIKSIEDYEIPRMLVVIKHLVIYRWVEIALIIIGFLLVFIFEPKSLGNGLGIGLVIQTTIMFVLDYNAEKRGKAYLDYLKSLL